MDTPISSFCQEKTTCEEKLNLPIAISTEINRANVILNRRMFKMAPNAPITEQARLCDILELIGSQHYIDRLTNGIDTPKEALWAAAFGISEGDRSSEKNEKRPGKPSGLLQIDVDHYSYDMEVLLNIQKKIMELPYILASFLSPSQDGVKAIAVLKKPSDFNQARALGVACTKEVCDYLDIIGYREESQRKKVTRYDLLPKEMQEKFGHGHIDFSVANDPRKACFIPAKKSNLLVKHGEIAAYCMEDDSEIGSGWYYQGCMHPFYESKVQRQIGNYNSNIEIKRPAYRPTAYEDRWQQYVISAIEQEFQILANAGAGCHHQAAISLGRTIKKYADYIGNIEELFARADMIIDGWSPAASNPSTEKKTVRDMQAYAETVSREQWIAQQRDSEKGVFTEIHKTDTTKIDPNKIDFDLPQPDDIELYDEKTTAELLLKVFLAKYRFTSDGRCINIHTCSFADDPKAKRKRFWEYKNDKGKSFKVTLDQAIARFGDVFGKVERTVIARPYMQKGEMAHLRPDPERDVFEECINCADTIPTLGLDMASLVTDGAKREAVAVADFCVSRFVDSENYPNPQIAQSIATKEAAYYFKYIYQAMTEPLNKYQCAIAMLSEARGTGKSTLTLDIPSILAGTNTKVMDQKDVKNANALRFAWATFEGALFGVIDDFEDPPDSMASSLRSFISSRTVSIERKGIQSRKEKNLTRLFISCNSKEFLNTLNSGTESERRWHLFSIKNKFDESNHEYDYVIGVLKHYLQRIHDEKISVMTDKETQAFRAALLLEFKERIDAYERKYGSINLNKAIDTAEFKKQKDLGLGHNVIARIAANKIVDSDNQRIGKRDLYSQIRMEKHDPSLTDRHIAEKMMASGWFQIKIYNGTRYYTLSAAGKEMFTEEEDDTEKAVEELKELPIREKLERINELEREGEIRVEWKDSEHIDVLCMKSNVLIPDVFIGVNKEEFSIGNLNFESACFTDDWPEPVETV